MILNFCREHVYKLSQKQENQSAISISTRNIWEWTRNFSWKAINFILLWDILTLYWTYLFQVIIYLQKEWMDHTGLVLSWKKDVVFYNKKTLSYSHLVPHLLLLPFFYLVIDEEHVQFSSLYHHYNCDPLSNNHSQLLYVLAKHCPWFTCIHENRYRLDFIKSHFNIRPCFDS